MAAESERRGDRRTQRLGCSNSQLFPPNSEAPLRAWRQTDVLTANRRPSSSTVDELRCAQDHVKYQATWNASDEAGLSSHVPPHRNLKGAGAPFIHLPSRTPAFAVFRGGRVLNEAASDDSPQWRVALRNLAGRKLILTP